MKTTIIDMSGEMSLGRADPFTGEVDRPYVRKPYESAIEKAWREGVRAATDPDESVSSCTTAPVQEPRAQEKAAPVPIKAENLIVGMTYEYKLMGDQSRTWRKGAYQKIGLMGYPIFITDGKQYSACFPDIRSIEFAAQVPTSATSGARSDLGVAAPDAADPPWVKWEGGECPVEGIHIRALRRNGSVVDFEAISGTCWQHDGDEHPREFVAYRLAHPTPRKGDLLPADHLHFEKQRLWLSDDTLRVWFRDKQQNTPWDSWAELTATFPTWADWASAEYHVAHVKPQD